MHTGPNGIPNDVAIALTSTSFSAVWTSIRCVERNGLIIAYIVQFHPLGGAKVYTSVTEKNFNRRGLNPYTNYIFAVAGVNVNGTGPYSLERLLRTNEDGKYI